MALPGRPATRLRSTTTNQAGHPSNSSNPVAIPFEKRFRTVGGAVMKSLFEPADRASIFERLNALQTSASRQWGKMNSAQMLAHCSAAIETSTGDRPMKQAFIGKLLAPFVRKSILGDKPFSRNSPTDPTFVIRDERDFGAERKRLIDLINRFAQRGPAETGK